MSVNYAAGLSAYDNKGKLGLPEVFDSPSELKRKVHLFTEWVRSSKHVVAHTGAGVSTAAGIPDFRGPKGVWTLEAEGNPPVMGVTFDEAAPTLTHMALLTLERLNMLKGRLKDTVLDWEAALPSEELKLAEQQCNLADLSICLGSTLQIIPAGTLPVLTKKNGGRVVIVNLQQTKQDKHADLIIHAKVDDVMQLLLKNLRIQCHEYMGPVFSAHTVHRVVVKKPKLKKRRGRKKSSKKTPPSVDRSANGVVKSSRGKKRRANATDNKKSAVGISPSSPFTAVKRRRLFAGVPTTSPLPSTPSSSVVDGAEPSLRRSPSNVVGVMSSFDVNYDGVVRLSFELRGSTATIVESKKFTNGKKIVVDPLDRKNLGVLKNGVMNVEVNDVDAYAINGEEGSGSPARCDGMDVTNNSDDDLLLCEFLPKKSTTINANLDDVDRHDDFVLPG